MLNPSQRTRVVMAHLANGATQKDVAVVLGISHERALDRIKKLRDRCGLTSCAALTAEAVREGWIQWVDGEWQPTPRTQV